MKLTITLGLLLLTVFTASFFVKSEKSSFASQEIASSDDLFRDDVFKNHPLQEAPLQEKPLQEDPLQEKPLQEDPLQEAPLQEDPLQELRDDGPMDSGKPLQEDPLQELPLQEEPLQERPIASLFPDPLKAFLFFPITLEIFSLFTLSLGTYRLGKLLFSRRTGKLASVIVLLFPAFILNKDPYMTLSASLITWGFVLSFKSMMQRKGDSYSRLGAASLLFGFANALSLAVFFSPLALLFLKKFTKLSPRNFYCKMAFLVSVSFSIFFLIEMFGIKNHPFIDSGDRNMLVFLIKRFFLTLQEIAWPISFSLPSLKNEPFRAAVDLLSWLSFLSLILVTLYQKIMKAKLNHPFDGFIESLLLCLFVGILIFPHESYHLFLGVPFFSLYLVKTSFFKAHALIRP